MKYKKFILKGTRSTRDFFVKLAKRLGFAFGRGTMCEFNVKLLDGETIVFNECEGVIRGEHEDFSRTIAIAKIDAVGYMTYEADPVLCDFFFLFNSEGVTYMMPTEWPHVHEIIGFLEEALPGYNNRIGVANSIRCTTLAVWPPSLAGRKFPLKETVFPPIFSPRDESTE